MLFPFPQSPSEPLRVVVTGAGIVTALGTGWDANAEGFRTGRAAFRPVTLFDVSRQRAHMAAEVDMPAVLPLGRLTTRQRLRLDRATSLLLLAADEAWRHAGWQPSDNLPFVLGTTAGGMPIGEQYLKMALDSPHRRRLQPTRSLYYQSQTQARLVADALGFTGQVIVVSNACASGTNSIGLAWDMIRSGRTDRVLAGGYESLTQMVFAGFDSLQALSPAVCRPFDVHRDGLTLGEGAALLALERLDHAAARGAEILGEIIGYGASLDQHHLTQPHPEGHAALASMRLACQAARVTPQEVDYLNAHGTGTPLNDSAEAAAILRWAGNQAATLPVSSTKASVGHLLGAAGSIEAAVCLMALRGQWLPPERVVDQPDPVCAFPLIREPREARLAVALSNSFGFGGVNATLALRRWS